MEGKVKKILGTVLAVCMIVSCMTGFGNEKVKANTEPVQYQTYNGIFENQVYTCDDYVKVSSADDLNMSDNKWYVFDGDVTIANRVTVTGTANIILMPGCNFSAPKGIRVGYGNTLNIYSNGTVKGENPAAGNLNAGENVNEGDAGIGGNSCEGSGCINIYGGKVTAKGGTSAAGIGGGKESNENDLDNKNHVTIRGGVITATGGRFGAGIGSGYKGKIHSVTIYAGQVFAFGGYEGGAGIGGGKRSRELGLDIQYKPMIKACGGLQTNSVTEAAGIGWGGDVTNNECEDPVLYVDSEVKWFGTDNETTGFVEINDSNQGEQRYKNSIVYHMNSAFMTASGDVIKAEYIKDQSTKTIELKIKPPTVESIRPDDKDTAKATLIGCEEFNSAFNRGENLCVDESQIVYYDADGNLIDEAPTGKGQYIAAITVDGVAAKAAYEIRKQCPVISVSAGTNLTYTGDEQHLITQGSATGGTLKYSLSENGTFSTDIPKGKNVGTYTVYYMVEGNNDYYSSIKYRVSAQINRASPNLSLTQDGWVKGETAKQPVLVGNIGKGNVVYAYKKQNESDDAYKNGEVPTEVGEYVVRATVAETGNSFGGSTTAQFSISAPTTEPTPDPASGTSTEPTPDPASGTSTEPTPDPASGTSTEPTPDPASGTTTDQTSEPTPASTPDPLPAPVIDYQSDHYPEEPAVEKEYEGITTTTIVYNPDGTISYISVTKYKDNSILTRETVRDKEGNFIEYKYTYEETKKNGTKLVQTYSEKADGSRSEAIVTTTKSGTVTSKTKEIMPEGTVISKEEKKYASGKSSLKEVITDADGTIKVVTEDTGASGTHSRAEYTAIASDDGKAVKLSLTKAEVTGKSFKVPDEIRINGQRFVVTEFGDGAFKGVGNKKRVTISVKAETEEEFEKICDMIRAAGAGKKVEFVKI